MIRDISGALDMVSGALDMIRDISVALDMIRDISGALDMICDISGALDMNKFNLTHHHIVALSGKYSQKLSF
jgi:hypothetical protein